MKIRLTDMTVKKLSFPESGQVTYWGETTPGFGLRCSSKSKSFVVMYGEKRKLKTLGRYPNLSLSLARTDAKRFFVQYTDEPQIYDEPSISFIEAKEQFIADSAGRNKPRTVADYTRLLNKHFPFSSKLDEINRQKIMKVISGLSKTPSEQSHAYVAIRTMMNWCVRHGLIEHSVVPFLKHGSAPRNRILDANELRAVYSRAKDVPYPFGPIVQLAILTGQRRSEIGSLRRSWINSDNIIFPEGFTKNKREHCFPISKTVCSIIESIPNTGDLFFPAATNFEKPFSGWAWHKRKFDTGMEGVGPYTLHDLRRTFSSSMAMLGTPIHVTEKLLNHVSGTISGVAAVYNRHSYMDEMRTAITAYDEYLENLINP